MVSVFAHCPVLQVASARALLRLTSGRCSASQSFVKELTALSTSPRTLPRAVRATVLCGIPCRAGYCAARDIVPCGIRCCVHRTRWRYSHRRRPVCFSQKAHARPHPSRPIATQPHPIAPISLHPIPSHPIPPHPTPSHPIPSHLISSHHISSPLLFPLISSRLSTFSALSAYHRGLQNSGASHFGPHF